MREAEIIDYANRLLQAHGDQAELEAAQKANEAERKNDAVQARDWQRIRSAIRTMRNGTQVQ